MKELLSHFLVWWQVTMVEALVRSTVLFFVAGGALLLLRHTAASTRVLIWRLTLAGMFALPIASLLLPPLKIYVTLPAPTSSANRQEQSSALPMRRILEAPPRRAMTGHSPSAAQVSAGTRSGQASSTALPPTRASAIKSPETGQAPGLNPVHSVSPLGAQPVAALPHTAALFVVWLAGITLYLLRLTAGFAALHRLAGRAKPVRGNLAVLVEPLARDANVRRPVGLLQGHTSDTGAPPITWGWRRPTIWLPHNVETWPQERVRAVLLHEIAHIARRDWLVQHMANLLFAFWWFHPGVWLVCRSLRQENERACDDFALSCGIKPSDYATHLLETTRMTTFRQSFSAAVSMAQISLLEARLRSILDADRKRNPLRRGAIVVLMLCAVLCLLPLAPLRISASSASARAPHARTSVDLPPASTSKINSPAVVESPTPGARNFTLNFSALLPGIPQWAAQASAQVVKSNLPGSHSSALVLAAAPNVKGNQADSDTINNQDKAKLDTADIVWGEPADGLQAGIRLTERRARYAIGEHVPAECYIRNTTQNDIAFAIPDEISFYDKDSPTIYAANGAHKGDEQQTVRYDLGPNSKVGRITLVLKAGEMLVLENPGINLGDVREHRLGATAENDLTPFPYVPDPTPGHFRLGQKFRYALTTPAAFAELYSESKKHDDTRERIVITPGGETRKTQATLSDIGDLPSGLLTGRAEFVVINKPPVHNPAAPIRSPEQPAALTWGKTLSGLQGALRLKENRRYFDGERMEWEYLVRNVGTLPITFTHEPSPGVSDTIPDIIGTDGKKYQAMGWVVLHTSEQKTVTLRPGEMAVVGHPALGINREDTMLSTTLHNPGRYRLSQYFHFWTAENGGQDLMSGLMEFELAGNEEKAAWGKTVAGLQAGLSFRGGTAPVKPGDTVSTDCYVRNVSGHAVTFEYAPVPQLGGVVPTVSDLNGNPGDIVALPQGPYTTDTRRVTLQPGEHILVGIRKLGIAAASGTLPESMTLRSGTGRYRISQSVTLRLREPVTTSASLSSGPLQFEVVAK